ncbi:hypothetical protein B0H14DRAFT_2392458, partial [Mycena olivaceomarginata]
KNELKVAYKLALEFAYEFEMLYYDPHIEHVHFVCQSIHTPLHMVQEVRRIGNLILYAQWTLERTISNLGEEIRQPKHMYANLSQHGLYRAQLNALKAMDPTFDRAAVKGLPMGGKDIGDGYQLLLRHDNVGCPPESSNELEALKTYLSREWNTPFNEERDNSLVKRWARLALPENGQVARSQFAEKEDKRFPSKMPEGFEIAEVLYFFCYNIQEDTPMALAMVSVFGVPDRALLKELSAAMWAAHPGLGAVRVIPAKDILSVVSMIPFPDERGVSANAAHKLKGMYYLYEKMGRGSSI